MKLLLTGAFGNLGQMCIETALAHGHDLYCFDRDTLANRRCAIRYKQIKTVFGDIREIDRYWDQLEGVEAIIHNACLLPPTTEENPGLAFDVNVQATERLVRLAEQSSVRPRIVYPSSVTVFGKPDSTHTVRQAEDPVAASDNYTRHKLAVEAMLRDSILPWVVLRVGVSVDARTLSADRGTFRKLLNVRADNPLDYVHPRDVALAMCRAAEVSDAAGKVLLIGGGEHGRINQHRFLRVAFDALGLSLPETIHGSEQFYTHWMDSDDSQRLLNYQQHDFQDYQREMAERLRTLRYTLIPLKFLINPLLPKLLKAL